MRTFARLVKKGDVLLNIGSHIGHEIIVYGKIAGPTGRIFIAEPYSASNRIVTKNIYLNGLDQIATVYKVAASNRKQKGYILIILGNTSSGSIYTDETIGDLKTKN